MSVFLFCSPYSPSAWAVLCLPLHGPSLRLAVHAACSGPGPAPQDTQPRSAEANTLPWEAGLLLALLGAGSLRAGRAL